MDVPAPYSLRLKRRKFLQLISTGLDIQVSLRTDSWLSSGMVLMLMAQRGKRLVRVDTDGAIVTTVFEDGSHATGQLLIGAEGAHSRIRQFLVGPETATLKPSAVVSSICTPRLPVDVQSAVRQLHPRYCAIFNPDGYFCWMGSMFNTYISIKLYR